MTRRKKWLSLLMMLCLILTSIGGLGSAMAEDASGELEILRIGVAALPQNMDPTINVGNTSIRVHYNIFETLIQANENDTYAQNPMLAESWERIDDYTIEFKLREDVTFHNGDPLTTKDVKYSFDRLKKDMPGVELARSLMAAIQDVEIIDDYTCRIITNVVDPILTTRVASSWGSWILPMDYIEANGDDAFQLQPIGTGPFKVVSFSPEKVVLERYDGYWGAKPNVKTIEYIYYPETSARITALLTGEVDIITQLPPDQIDLVANTSGLNVESLNITNMHVVRFWTDKGIISDKYLRQALSLSIDRQLLSDAFWAGKAIVPKGHQYPEFGDMYFDDYPVAEYNPEKAKELLAKSSYAGETISYELQSGYYTFSNEVAESIVDMWADIGVKAQVVFKDKQDAETSVRNWSNSMRFPDPAGGLWLLWGSINGTPPVHWPDMPQEFIDAGEELVSIIDPVRRKELARTLMDIFEEEVPGTVLYYPLESWGVRDGINWTPYASQTMDFRADNFSID